MAAIMFEQIAEYHQKFQRPQIRKKGFYLMLAAEAYLQSQNVQFSCSLFLKTVS
jgi:hypothetical protein